ncbi:hypothetical protein PO124_20500 [Bacillus licheniformis]|nr:hypothetical protein [Bacillus licheniformis]
MFVMRLTDGFSALFHDGSERGFRLMARCRDMKNLPRLLGRNFTETRLISGRARPQYLLPSQDLTVTPLWLCLSLPYGGLNGMNLHVQLKTLAA